MAEVRRLRECVEAWPEASTGSYDPRCCRFPKSCSATVYYPDDVAEEDLEPSPSVVGGAEGHPEKDLQTGALSVTPTIPSAVSAEDQLFVAAGGVSPVPDTIPEITEEAIRAFRAASNRHTRADCDEPYNHPLECGGVPAGLAAARPYLVAAAPAVPLEALQALFAFWDCWHNQVGLCDPGDNQPGVASLLMVDDAHALDDLSDAVEPFEDQLRAGLFPGTGTPATEQDHEPQ